MKIGVFLKDYSPEIGGGYTIQDCIFQSLLELAGECPHRFVIFCRNPNELMGKLTYKGIEFIDSLGGFRERLASRAKRGARALRGRRQRIAREEEVARSLGVEFAWFIGGGIQLDIPYLTTVWDLQYRLQPWFPEVSAQGGWEERETFNSTFMRRATFIIAGTQTGRKEIERFYHVTENRIRILPHPTPRYALEASAPEERNPLVKYGIPDHYLFYPAQFWPHKNHANLLFAIRALRDNYHLTLPVVFVGSDQGNLSYVQRLVDELRIREQVHILGFVPQGDLVSLYQHAFALCYLSFFGPENLPPLEAFGLGCPVIASNVAGAEEQLGRAALLVDPNSVENISEAILSLYKKTELRKTLIERGRKRAAQWTGEDFVRGVFSIFDEFEVVRRCWE